MTGAEPWPLASSRTVSLVLVSPSMLIQLKLLRTAADRAAWSTGAVTAALVVITLSMVAMSG